jgi:uncharacterized membrane protein
MKKVSIILMTLLYVVAGLYHFLNPGFYLKIMPRYIPFHLFFVYATGVIEIILGILLLIKKYQKKAAWLIVIMLIAFLPVHIQMLQDAWISFNIKFISAALRLPLQFVLIYWTYKTFNLKLK